MKLVGGIIICLCAYFLGSGFCRGERGRITQGEELLSIFRYIRDEISKNKTPTRIVFTRLNAPSLGVGFLSSLARTNDLYLSVSSCGNLYIRQEELDILRVFSSNIGSAAAECQTAEFDYCIEKLGTLILSLRGALPVRERLGRVIPVFVGALFIILFI